jgi:glycosyltransferase involved in cell wall biosynthesis
MIHLGIDATNLRQGGGITHLIELLSCFDQSQSSIKKVTVWSSYALECKLPKKDWLIIRRDNWIDKNRFVRFLGQQFHLSGLMKSAGCHVGFFPGGVIPLSSKLPAVTMSQNMLPFDLPKARLFGLLNPVFWKLLLLRYIQSRSFNRADGIIFLSQYAQLTINKTLNLKKPQALIPHGIDQRFLKFPREQKAIDHFSFDNPFKFIYISILMPYKHQIEVANSISQLRYKGLPISCQFIGPTWGWYGGLVQKILTDLDPKVEYLSYVGEMAYEELETAYHKADGFIFASSCENLPNILIEAMSAGVPIACSNSCPMPDILGDAGFYFAPSDSKSISLCLKEMLDHPNKRFLRARKAFDRSSQYSWEECSIATFEFISRVKASVAKDLHF